MATQDGLRAFAKQASSKRREYPICETCKRYADACKDIEEFVLAQRSGDPDFKGIPISAANGRASLHLWLQQNYDYDLSAHSLRRHVHLCVQNGKEEGK